MTTVDQSSLAIARRLTSGVGSTALRQVVSTVEPVLLVPLFLRAWGPEGYGRYLFLVAIVSYLALLEFGAQSYIGNLLAIERARGNMALFREALSEAVSLWMLVALAGALAVTLVLSGALTPVGLPIPLSSGEGWVVAFLAGHALVGVPMGIYGTQYQACGLYTRGLMIGNTTLLAGLAVGAGALYAGLPPAYYAGLIFATRVALTIVLLLDSRRCIPECRNLTLNLRNAWKARRHVPGAFHFWLLSLAQTVKVQGPILIVGAAGGPSLVSLYATHRALANVAGYGAVLLQGPLWPELSALWGRQRLGELRRMSLVATKINILVTGAIALLLWLLVPMLYPLWTGKELALQPAFFALLLIQGVLAAGWSTSSWCLQAANRHQTVAFWAVVNAIVTIVAAGLLVGGYGVVGIGLATLFADLVFGLMIFPRLASVMLTVRPAAVYWEMARAVAPILVFFAIARVVVRDVATWPAALVVSALFVMFAYPIGCLVLGRKAMREILGFIKGLTIARSNTEPRVLEPALVTGTRTNLSSDRAHS